MQGMGYVNNANLDAAGNYTNIPDAAGKFNAINVEWLGWDFALELRALVAILFLIAGVMLFIGLGLVYNLDKKTLAKMNADLGRDVEADDVLTYTTAEDNDNLA
jgi:hypothetical protein